MTILQFRSFPSRTKVTHASRVGAIDSATTAKAIAGTAIGAAVGAVAFAWVLDLRANTEGWVGLGVGALTGALAGYLAGSAL
jgi:F0F1-type ATP synthase assembly protein I